MVKIVTVMMTEGSHQLLLGVLNILAQQTANEGRQDLSGTLLGLVKTLSPQEVTPLEA